MARGRSWALAAAVPSALLLALPACSPVTVTPLTTDHFRLEARTFWAAPSTSSLVAYMERRAVALCPRGFTRTGETLVTAPDGPSAVWDIACE